MKRVYSDVESAELEKKSITELSTCRYFKISNQKNDDRT